MDFDLSKENIQPLRGGRNVHQLEMALQAQTNLEYQMQLQQQKEEFEQLIRNDTSEDPLKNYYNYISWIEQSYPKNGYEGNLVNLLESVLGKFENDSRYKNDRRFCRLWIKYIDLFPNPLELYQMMGAKKLCTGCADFYKAWAYYCELAGDYQKANSIFEEGKHNLIYHMDEYEELETAHRNLITAAGEHMIHGPNEVRLKEKRHALTSLQTFKSGKVGSVRLPTAINGTYNSTTWADHGSSSAHFNVPLTVYEDRSDASGLTTGAAPISIINVARRQEAPKENTLKPGPWTTVPIKKKQVGHKSTPGFTVHEDTDDVACISTPGISRLPNRPTVCLEDYSDWRVAVCLPEESNPKMIPKYPKHRAYIDPTTEFSLEELRATRYRQNPLNVGQAETCQAVQSILVDDDDDDDDCVLVSQEPVVPTQKKISIFEDPVDNVSPNPRNFHNTTQTTTPVTHSMNNRTNHSLQPLSLPQQHPQIFHSPFGQTRQQIRQVEVQHTEPVRSPRVSNYSLNVTAAVQPPGFTNQPQGSLKMLGNNASFGTALSSPVSQTGYGNLLWSPQATEKSATDVYQSPMEIPVPVQPKGSAMKTAFKCLTSDELAETGSRGGMDIAVTAADSARPAIPIYSDNSSSSSDVVIMGPLKENVSELDSTCTQQQFNFNLNVMRVSTPQIKTPITCIGPVKEEMLQNSRKTLFATNVEKDKALSTILEETKSSYVSSSCSSGINTKSSLFNNNQTTNKMQAISEEHNSYLAQNLMANAALRSSLLGDFMDISAPPIEPPTTMQSSPIHSPVRKIPAPAVVRPLDKMPDDPFSPFLINQLLERVAFPGPHSQGFVQWSGNPRLVVKKEPIYIANDRYLIEKQLGKGQFGTVFKAQDLMTGRVVALKYQRPAHKWEFYICRELQARLVDHPLREKIMDISIGYFSDLSSVLVSEYRQMGSLLDAANTVKSKTTKNMSENLCFYFVLEMLNIVQALHQVHVIHADIKPDNFLVYMTNDNTLGLQLIDFGCSIDMTLFPTGTMFTCPITTEDFVCCEVKDGRPWSYHTDLFCVAASAHVLLFREYIQLKKSNGYWYIAQKLPRYCKVDTWNTFFSDLLNQQNNIADITKLQDLFESKVKETRGKLDHDLRALTNLLMKR